jgi:hypothetical protein
MLECIGVFQSDSLVLLEVAECAACFLQSVECLSALGDGFRFGLSPSDGLRSLCFSFPRQNDGLTLPLGALDGRISLDLGRTDLTDSLDFHLFLRHLLLRDEHALLFLATLPADAKADTGSELHTPLCAKAL